MRPQGIVGSLLLCLTLILQCGTEATSTQQRLYHALFDDYVPLRPTENWSQPVIVQFVFSLYQLKSLDGKSQQLETLGRQLLFWKDPSLMWNRSDYGGMEYIEADPRKIWTPLVGLLNSAGDVVDPNWENLFIAIVFYNGSVGWSRSGRFLSSCDLNMGRFPFDRQTCHIDFTNVVHGATMVSLRSMCQTVDKQFYMKSKEFELVSATVNDTVEENHLQSFFSFSTVRVTLVLQRRPGYYMFTLIIPTMALALLSSFTFLVPVDSGEKLSLAITILLSFTVFLLILSDNVPQTTDPLPFLVVYLTVTICISALSTVVQMITMNMHYKFPLTIVPQCLRGIVACVESGCRRTAVAPQAQSAGRGNLASRTSAQEAGSKKTMTDKPGQGPVILHEEHQDSDYKSGCDHGQIQDPTMSRLLGEVEQIREVITDMDQEEKQKDDWRKAARTLDKIFFGIFFLVQLAMLIYTCIFLFTNSQSSSGPDVFSCHEHTASLI